MNNELVTVTDLRRQRYSHLPGRLYNMYTERKPDERDCFSGLIQHVVRNRPLKVAFFVLDDANEVLNDTELWLVDHIDLLRLDLQHALDMGYVLQFRVSKMHKLPDIRIFDPRVHIRNARERTLRKSHPDASTQRLLDELELVERDMR